MNTDSRFFRLLLVSPWMLPIFLVIPVLVILSITLHAQLPQAGPKPLLINNICFALLAACRLLWYLSRIGKTIRYGAVYGRPRQAVSLSIPVTETRGLLSRSGYSFAADGSYSEKRDLGYLGTMVMYAGLLLLLSVGSWDNLRQFSGVLLDGMGPATSLNKAKSYRRINKGPIEAGFASLPRMQIIRQYLPDATNPKGATEIVLIPEDGKPQSLLLKPGQPVTYGAFDIYMTKIVFEPQIVIKTRDSITLFDSLVRLDPLVQKRGPYSFYGVFQGILLGGGVYYQPETSTLMVVITYAGKKVVTDMVFQVDKQVIQGDYILSCAKMGQWSEIHVVHRRHKGLLVVGGLIAILGLLLRIVIRPQRVWLEETPDGCMFRAVGKEAQKLLKLES